MTSYDPGAVVLVRFPFTNLETSKKRPALVLRQTEITSKSRILTVAMITSQIDGLKLEGDVHLKDWKQAQLLHPSLVRLSKLATLDQELVEKKLRALSKTDLEACKKTFQRLYRFWI